MEKYEIEPISYPGEWFYSMIATITGCDRNEIQKHFPAGKETYRPVLMKSGLQALGFNTNKNFIPFDPETEYPCIMRIPFVNEKGKRNGWWATVYYDRYIYVFGKNGAQRYNAHIIKRFGHYFLYWSGNAYRITTMLQVWI